MANYKDSLIQSNPMAAWMLDSSGTTETDITVGGRVASTVVSDKVGIPMVSGGARTYTLNSTSDIVRYPTLNIWSKAQEGRSFSVEFVISPLSSAGEVIIFAPTGLGGRVSNNKIALLNNKLSFVISNADYLTAYTKKYEAYTFLDYTGDTYHCVAVYSPSSISLYVNGNLEDVVSIDRGFQWIHQEAATYSFETTGASGSSVALSALAIYKEAAKSDITMGHYRALMVNSDPKDIVGAYSGQVFMINDTDRIKGFYYNDPLLSSWEDVTLDNLSVIDNRLSLDTFDPPTLNTGTDTYTTSHLALSTSQYLRVVNIDDLLSNGAGSVGTYVRYTAARHGALSSGEYCILALQNSDKSSVIELVEKSDKKIYLRYKSNGILFTDALLASPATGSDSDNYAYVVFSSKGITAYWNTSGTTTTIDITSDTGTASPKFGSGSTLTVGASADGVNFWGSHFWWLNVWSNPKPIASLSTFKDEVYQYTLKLASSLNVSQLGTAVWELETGSDGLSDQVNQSRIWYTPELPTSSLLVQAGITSTLTTVSPNSIIPGVGPGASTPETINIMATLTTDDSVGNVVYLKSMGTDIMLNSEVRAENGQDELLFGSSPNIMFSLDRISTQGLLKGARINSPASACQIYSRQTTSPTTDNVNIPEVSTSQAPPTYLSVAKTVEFWARPATSSSGLIYKFNGTDPHTLSYNATTRIFTVAGFDNLYIDGVNITLTAGASAAMPSTYFNDKWHMFHLVKNDVVDQNEATVFATASGSPTRTTDSGKFYYGLKSFKLVSGGSQGFVSAYTLITGLNTASAAKNTLSFFVYPNTGITSVVTNFRYNSIDSLVTHSGLLSETWNLVTRTFTNPAIVTTLDVRIGTPSISQTLWIDGTGLVKGSDPFVRFDSASSNSSWFGLDISSPGTQQSAFDLQNVAVYVRALPATRILEAYNEYIGAAAVRLALPDGVSNILPSTGNSSDDPDQVTNRNPTSAGETLFEDNPVHLSSSWAIINSN